MSVIQVQRRRMASLLQNTISHDGYLQTEQGYYIRPNRADKHTRWILQSHANRESYTRAHHWKDVK